MRTHYCGLINSQLIGQEVTLCGWAHRRRDHGGVIFIDLRDREGIAQIVCDPDRPEMQGLYRNTRLQPPANCVPTFPSWRPQRAIDHVLVTPALGIATMQAVPAAHSDHLALSVELDVPEHALG